ncbi:MAG: PD-(D/E)XK nuclease domain-containing protein [Candidatus Pacearchaeota archaeon]
MIKEKIEEFYLSKQEDKDREHFYITDAGKCPRAIYFQFKKAPKKAMDARILRVFEHGDYTHLRIISTLFSLGLVKATEIEIPNKEIVHGRADAIINIDNEPYVVEIKSINNTSFSKLESPDPDHLKQIQMYLHFFKIKKGIIIYENKNTQEIKEFIVEYNENIAKEILEKFYILKAQIQNNIIPSVDDVEEWRCNYCPYSDECKKYS